MKLIRKHIFISGETSYSFFMMTDDEIKSYDSHQVWTIQDAENILCTSTKYRLYPYRNFICATAQEALNTLIEQQNNETIPLIIHSRFLLKIAVLHRFSFLRFFL